MNRDSILESRLAQHLVANYFNNLARGKVIQVVDVDMDLATSLSAKCLELLRKNEAFQGSVVTLSKRNNENTGEFKAERVVELRNKIQHSLIVFIPQEYARTTQSIASFDSVSIPVIMNKLAVEITQNLRPESFFEFGNELMNEISKFSSIENWLLLLIECAESSDPREYFCNHLWKIGLIPDSSEKHQAIELLIRNLEVCKSLSARGNPLQTTIERFDQLGLIRNTVTEELRNLLIQADSNISAWQYAISKSNRTELQFSNWQFSSGTSSVFHNFYVLPFVGPSGSVKRTSGVYKSPNSGDYFAEKKFVKIEWISDPSQVSADFSWNIEIMSSVDKDVAEVEEQLTVRKSQTSYKVNFERVFGDRFEEFIGRRICLRVSAVEPSGNVLIKSNGEKVESYSEPFVLVIDSSDGGTGTGTGNLGSNRCMSVAEIGILAVLDNNIKKVSELEKPFISSANIEDQTLTVYLDSRYSVNLNSYICALESIQFANPDKVFSFYDSVSQFHPKGTGLKTNSITGLDSGFLKARTALMKLFARESDDSTQEYFETTFWNDDKCNSLNTYIDEYLKILNSAKSNPEMHAKLLEMDTLEVTVDTSVGKKKAILLTPLHPLRALWLRNYSLAMRKIAIDLLELPIAERRKNIDLNLIKRLMPINYPFVIPRQDLKYIHAYEASFGTAVYLNLEDRDNLQLRESINRMLDIQFETKFNPQTALRMKEHFTSYLNTTEQAVGIKVAVFNSGNAAMESEIFQNLQSQAIDINYPSRIQVVGYSYEPENPNSLGKLKEVAEQSSLIENSSDGQLFRSSFSLRNEHINKINTEPEASNISILHGASRTLISKQDENAKNHQRDGLFGGLITYLFSYAVDDEEGIRSFTSPTLLGEEVKGISLSELHRLYAEVASGSEYGFALELFLDRNQTALINQIHLLSDWVLTIDRFIGPALYEDVLSIGNSGIVVIDYSPDFVDGFGDRLTLTTTKYFEITRIISRAMSDLGLEDRGVTAKDVLRGLASISGRLAMRLLGNNSLATEAVGLYAVYQHLFANGDLNSHIIIPIDAHQEIFSPKRHDEQRDNERCDLLLVRFNTDGWEIKFVEVKTRRSRIIDDLPATMATQIDNTDQWLRHLLFDDASSRVDKELQWSRWSSLLHFYADRSRIHGLISESEIGELHQRISSVCFKRTSPKMTNKGFIVCLDFEGQIPDLFNLNLDLEILNESKVRDLSFVTKRELTEKNIIEGESIHPLENSGEQIIMNAIEPTFEDHKVLAPNHDMENEEVNRETEQVELPKSTKEGDADESDVSNKSAKEDTQTYSDILGTPLAIETPNEFQINLGIDTAGQSVDWNLSVKGSPHGLIAGVSGHGKSVTTRNIIFGFAQAGVPTIIFDFHGEMKENSNLRLNALDVGTHGLPFNPFSFDRTSPMPITSAAQEISEILRNIGSLGDIQTAHVRAALLNIYQSNGLTDQDYSSEKLPTVDEFASELERVQTANRGGNALERLSWFTSFGLFRDNSEKSFDPLNSRGYVFDFSKYRQEEIKLTAGSFILKKIYNDMFMWGKTDRLRLAIVLDEAHRLATDPTIPKLMKEGRKYGISLLLASQNLDDFAPEVVQNAGLRIAFRNNYPASRQIAALLNQRDAAKLSQRIEQLPVARAIIVTESLRNPRETNMRSID